PPLRTLDELPGNLPVQRTSFIGRVVEVKEAAPLVATERLVTLTGVGGVGKSRLALQVAAEVAPEFKDGVWFASLAALEEGALELAAARVRGMSPADIAGRLDQRLRLLTSSDRLAPGRHRTLDAAVRWSYELLDATQQRVFDRLCMFAGPFTIEAAEAVVAGD